MGIKSNGWTALPAVKIVSFVAIIALGFAFLCNTFLLARQFDNSEIDLDVVFADFSGNDAFYNRFMSGTLFGLQSLLFFESEENIRNGNCLRWVEQDDGDYWLESSDGSRTWGTVNAAEYLIGEAYRSGSAIWWSDSGNYSVEYSPEQLELQRKSLETDAINNQLLSFRNLQNNLQNQNGLLYYIAKPGFGLSNADDYSIEFFVKQPVYLLVENGMSIAQSHSFYPPPLGDCTIYLAYTADAIGTQNTQWQSVQRTVIAQIALMIFIMVVAFALLIVLLCGAGRKRCYDTVYFNIFDKPYLDTGFFLLCCCEIAALVIISSIFKSYGGSYIRATQNTRRFLIVLAVASVMMLPPVLCYAISFAKRVKAGRWWRHTLIWRVWDAVWGSLTRFVKSLWAGVPLTFKVGVFAFCIYAAILFTAAASGANETAVALGFILALVFAVPMLRYARRLHALESGAKAASKGDYSDIGVKGGELGSIAESINNISAGIETAVELRLKSERLKTELITNVSHDIRTPLTSMITYADLLKNEGLTSEKAPEYLDILIQKSQRLKTLTDELFEAAKAATGNIEANLETLDFAALMRQVLGELDERVQSSGLDFRLNLPEHAWVLADGKLLWRVAENLLSNVFKYTLLQSRVYIDLVQDGGDVRLDIKNISAQPLNVDPSELIERFKRGDDSRSGDGSGLGLSIVQSFVEAQNSRFKLAIDGDLFKASVYVPRSSHVAAIPLDLTENPATCNKA